MHSTSTTKSNHNHEFLINTGFSIVTTIISFLGLVLSNFRGTVLWLVIIFSFNIIIFGFALYCTFPPSPRWLKTVFALIFIIQLPQFVEVWSERYDDDTKYVIRLLGGEEGKPKKNENSELELLKKENIILKQEIEELKTNSIPKNREISSRDYNSCLFPLGVVYLFGLFGSLIGCVYAGHP